MWRFTFTFGGLQSEWGALILAIYLSTSVKTAKFVAPWYIRLTWITREAYHSYWRMKQLGIQDILLTGMAIGSVWLSHLKYFLCGSFLVSWLRRCNMKGHVLPMITALATGQTQTFQCRVHNSRHQATTIRISFKMKNLSRLFHSCPQVSTVYSWLVIQEVIQWKGVQTTSQLSLAWQQHNIIHQEKVNNDDVSLSVNSWQNKEFIILLICKSL